MIELETRRTVTGPSSSGKGIVPKREKSTGREQLDRVIDEETDRITRDAELGRSYEEIVADEVEEGKDPNYTPEDEDTPEDVDRDVTSLFGK